jgi:hypothetical protein
MIVVPINLVRYVLHTICARQSRWTTPPINRLQIDQGGYLNDPQLLCIWYLTLSWSYITVVAHSHCLMGLTCWASFFNGVGCFYHSDSCGQIYPSSLSSLSTSLAEDSSHMMLLTCHAKAEAPEVHFIPCILVLRPYTPNVIGNMIGLGWLLMTPHEHTEVALEHEVTEIYSNRTKFRTMH